MSDQTSSPANAHNAAADRNWIAERIAQRSQREPAVRHQPEDRFEPFPLTDMQHAYWVGRDSGLAGAGAMQMLVEFVCSDLDVSRLERAWNALVERHDMLRAVVGPEGLQRIVSPAPTQTVAIVDLSMLPPEELDAAIRDRRAALHAEVSTLDRWPQSELVWLRTESENPRAGRLLMRLDMWCVDGRSFQVLIEELATLYLDPETALPPLSIGFRDYVTTLLETEKSPEFARSLEWWRERLADLPPPPPLPYARQPVPGETPRFHRHAGKLDKQQTARLKATAVHHGLGMPSIMATAYAEVLSRWSGAQRFTLNVPRFNRPDWHPDLNNLIGEFASFSLLEIDLGWGNDFVSRAQAVQERLWSDLEHQAVSGVRQLRELGQIRGGMDAGAMPVVFTTMPDRRSSDARAMERAFEAFGRLGDLLTSTPQVWLDAQYFELNDELLFNWDAVEALFPAGMVADMFEAYEALVVGLAEDPAAWHTTAPIALPEAQRRRRAAVNDTAVGLSGATVPELIAAAFARTPDAPALIGPDRTLTMAETGAAAAVVARALRDRGVRRGEVVALAIERGWRQAVAVLGVQAVGAAYLPLDLGSPPARLGVILADAKPRLALMGPDVAPAALGPTPEIDTVEIDPIIASADPEERFAPDTALDLPAYVIYTSGSTGSPKGVVVGQRALANLIEATNKRFAVGAEDRALAITALHHDLSVYDLFGPLAAGGGLVLLDPERALEARHWLDRIVEGGATIWNSVPRLAELLAQEAEQRGIGDATSPRRFILGGDWVPKSLPSRLRALWPDLAVTTIGGPTETTVWNIMYDVPEGPIDGPSIPYGRAIANCGYRILDTGLADCPDWVPGEMYCSGLCLADGYLNDPETTAERFIRHPDDGERLYRTGDRGRYRPDGTIEFLGRVDFQLNVGGLRTDPSEIEATIAAHPEVTEAVVVAIGDGATTLAAFLRPAEAAGDAELGDWCRARLPVPLVPRLWHRMDALPLTGNGKVDRQALAATPLQSFAVAGRPPSTPLEKLIASIWSEMIGSPVEDAEASFFSMGGDSLTATRALVQIEKRLGTRPPLSALFARPTVAGLADTILTRLAEGLSAENGGSDTPMEDNLR